MAGKRLQEIPFSVLDLAPITEGNTAATTFKNSLALAQRVEALGYKRYWLSTTIWIAWPVRPHRY